MQKIRKKINVFINIRLYHLQHNTKTQPNENYAIDSF